MRMVIAHEGVDLGYFINKGALYWEEESFPVVTGVSFSVDRINHPIGTATELRREEDGKITAEISVPEYEESVAREGWSFEDMFGFYIYATNVDDTIDVLGERVVTKARVRLIYMHPVINPGFPVIKE